MTTGITEIRGPEEPYNIDWSIRVNGDELGRDHYKHALAAFDIAVARNGGSYDRDSMKAYTYERPEVKPGELYGYGVVAMIGDVEFIWGARIKDVL